jgi:hypothetical protein
MGNVMEKKKLTKQMNGEHGNGQMWRLTKKKSYIAQTNYKHFKGGYGRLTLNNVYTWIFSKNGQVWKNRS